ncbi:MAG: hypothetical protein HOP12_02070 [Candidatus Eisenbacteria bacterium]|uniref:BlaI/MecI/CopY family transcriptional regulator n=1 Tax=Eiseniibacteriota bacterium TaxID=2212470 RepID=A0A849SJ97_UNCEI|nr:hypothetical protein [Candidatus Eisenbacteria bacterium]
MRLPRVPEAELDVLVQLRRAGEATASEIGRALAERRPMAHGSVLTLLGRLETKRLVARRRGPIGKAFVYRATERAEGALEHLVDSFVRRVFEGDSMNFVASLLARRPTSAREIEHLESVLAELKARRTPRARKGSA